jgi:hypothetical protein
MTHLVLVLMTLLLALPFTTHTLVTINVSKHPSGPAVPDDFLGCRGSSVHLSPIRVPYFRTWDNGRH